MKGPNHKRQSNTKLLLPFYRSHAPFKTLLLLYSHDWDKLALSMVFYVIKHSPEWIRPVVIANIIDIISRPQEHSLTQLWLNGAILAVSIIQNIPTHYLHIMSLSAATRQMETNVRDLLTRQLQQLSIGFYKQRSIGVLQVKLLRDVEEIQQLTSSIFQFLPSALLTILIAIAITAMRAWKFLFFFAATVPAAVILVQVLKKPIQQPNQCMVGQLKNFLQDPRILFINHVSIPPSYLTTSYIPLAVSKLGNRNADLQSLKLFLQRSFLTQ